MSQGEKYPK